MLSLLSSSCFIVCIGLVLWKLCDYYCDYLMKCQCDGNRGQTLYATRRREVEGTIKQIAKLTHLMRLEQRFDFDDIRLPRSATFADNDKWCLLVRRHRTGGGKGEGENPMNYNTLSLLNFVCVCIIFGFGLSPATQIFCWNFSENRNMCRWRCTEFALTNYEQIKWNGELVMYIATMRRHELMWVGKGKKDDVKNVATYSKTKKKS